MRRHPYLSVHTSELTTHARLQANSKVNTKRYFDDVEKHLVGKKPSQIWNMDEGGFDLGTPLQEEGEQLMLPF